MNEFLHMGGYAAYVWSAYGIALIVLVANILQPVIARRKLQKRLQRIYQQEQD